ncbi:MAG TPA: RNA ligase family protein [Candidatus Glassbacteria bacterium]|nr:RNA ligase family protein [Candidatus Glassbacteria bacterium]
MKSYASIPKWSPDYFGKHVFGFDKIDGSNFRAEWNRKLSKKSNFTLGFGKYGTRREAIHKNSPFAEGIQIFEDKFAIELDQIFKENKVFRGVDRITVFGEFFGNSSFAGIHNWDELHDIYIYDIFLYKKGFLPPADFIKIFDNEVDCSKSLYQGIFTEEVLKHVEDGDLSQWQYPQSTQELEEGIVFKGVEDGNIFMFKVKTKEWLAKVKELYGETKSEEY